MQKTPDRIPKKTLGMVAAIALSLVTLTGIVLKSRSSQANADKNSLKQQRTAMGMPDPDEMRNRMLDNMARLLGLTETQKQQMKKAQEAGPDPRAIFEDNSLSREQKFERMRKLREDQEARVRAILTPDQQIRYEQIQTQMRERFRGRQGARPRGPGGSASPPNTPVGGRPE